MNLPRSQSDHDLSRNGPTKVIKPKSPPNSSHKIVVDLGGVLPYIGGVLQEFSIICRRPNALTGPQLIVNCPCGDTWQPRYKELQKGQHFPSEHKRTDRVLQYFENRGHAIQDVLHSGKFGAVYLGYSKYTAEHEAIKIMHADKLLLDDPELFNRTLEIHEGLRHPCIIQLLSHTTIKGTLCLILEWCELGSLEELLKRSPGNLLPESVCQKYFKDLISGLGYVHRQNVVHLNLCAKNLLINKLGRLKISDFSHACRYATGDVFPNGHRINFFGHLPPEVFSSATMLPKFNPQKADIWASGVVLFQTASGRLPFGGEDSYSHALNLSERRGIRPAYCLTSARFSQQLKELLNHILNPCPEARATIAFIKAHPFFLRHPKKPYIGNLHLIGLVSKTSVGPVMEQLLHDHGI